MNEKELQEKLKDLQQIKPDSDWKSSNRELLFSQISSSNTPTSKTDVVFALKNAFRMATQPAMAVVLIIVVLGGALGLKVVQRSKPGDSLYIAKLVSEKAQLAVVFDEEKKSRLGLKFANKRAREIASMLSSKEDNGEERQDELTESFKYEIGIVKDSIKSMKVIPAKEYLASDDPDESDEDLVFTAGLGKVKDGMQISGPEDEVVDDSDATTTYENIKSGIDMKGAEEILEMAEKLFDEENYEATLEKLKEIDIMMGDTGGEVKGASEEATSTAVSDI